MKVTMRAVVLRKTFVLFSTLYWLPLVFLLTACAGKPLNPWSADSPPLVMVPVANAGIDDRRGRFREIFCEVLESRGQEWPDYRPCDEALTRVADEPVGTGEPSTACDLPHAGHGWRITSCLMISPTIRS